MATHLVWLEKRKSELRCIVIIIIRKNNWILRIWFLLSVDSQVEVPVPPKNENCSVAIPLTWLEYRNKGLRRLRCKFLAITVEKLEISRIWLKIPKCLRSHGQNIGIHQASQTGQKTENGGLHNVPESLVVLGVQSKCYHFC